MKIISFNGIAALTRELGVVGMIRFMQQFETGEGDYSRDRHQWLAGQDVDAINNRIQEKRKKYKTE